MFSFMFSFTASNLHLIFSKEWYPKDTLIGILTT